MELTYASQNKLPVAAIKNQGGKYVLPSADATTAAIAAFKDQLAKDPRTPIANPPASAADAYPISTLTFLIVPKDGKDVAKRTDLKQFITYVVTEWAGDGRLVELCSSARCGQAGGCGRAGGDDGEWGSDSVADWVGSLDPTSLSQPGGQLRRTARLVNKTKQGVGACILIPRLCHFHAPKRTRYSPVEE